MSLASVRDTSLLAFLEVEPSLGERQGVVLAALERLGAATNMELSLELGWSINRVTPRVLELRQLGRVVLREKRSCKVTGRTALAWEVYRRTT